MNKLSDISNISLGYSFRGALNEVEGGSVGVIQAKDVNNNNTTRLPNITFDKSKYFLKNGDILLSIRGKSCAMAIYPQNKQIIASSSLLIIRLFDNCFLPEYIALYLNHNRTQSVLSSISTGSSVKTISKFEVSNLSIPRLSLHTQKRLISLNDNIQEQKRIIFTKEQLLNNVIEGAIEKTLKGVNV